MENNKTALKIEDIEGDNEKPNELPTSTAAVVSPTNTQNDLTEVSLPPIKDSDQLLEDKSFLAPYQTYGQSCTAVACNPSQGLTCSNKSCGCPKNYYWSTNSSFCRAYNFLVLHTVSPLSP
ncbi:unnamed protein product [Didymodactylos carnosus]|uniref:Uncharacterized protein n=1 Tax=Didymodactylos carnosus TaxID=1234261 RepID=A0A814LFB8_9BILA|nr:unnamed protein product [Didymodactylos carnosus]CAF1062547.1 unnamed protein product [Didymodactylos carnosus]CAF3764109.1 unnamed protein product [Didymodactylos carnosus]CAF3830707.1 unnamed protein product [Didymodactylos carnosus]